MIAGFVVPGVNRREFLIRVIGPSLAQFGVTNTWVDPDFTVIRSGGPAATSTSPSPHYGDWSAPSRSQLDPTVVLDPTIPITGFKKIFATVGAFPLTDGSKDAAAVVGLLPGAYTVVCSAPSGDVGGDVIIEVYSLP